jgi:hypothetical protein
MNAFVPTRPVAKSITQIARLTFMCGGAGMALSLWYLASSHPLDVLAGAAGFVAGAVMIAGGLLSLAVLSRPATEAFTPAVASPVDVSRWLTHFRRHRERRPEPDWQAPLTLSNEVVKPLVRSLEQFQLGDGGGPAYLIAHDRERLLAQSAELRTLVDLWFAEEREHSRLLGALVERYGGQPIDGHWSFTAFCWTRRWFGVRFELTVLLLTEIVSTAYYRLLYRHGGDPALRATCRLILRDETGHVAFHRDRLARAADLRPGPWWEARFRLLGLGAATMLWINHAPGLRAVGGSRAEFYRTVWREMSRFLRQLRQDIASEM